MKKRNITLIVLILIFITATYYVLSRKDSEDQELKNDVVIENNLEREEKPKETKEVVSKANADIAIGNEAPNFTLKNLEDEEISLEDYRGKKVLINFWATWCVFCDIEMPDIQRLDKENEDVVVLAVNVMEDKETVKKYIADGEYEFEVVLDEKGALSRTYLVGGYPTSYFVDEEGILIQVVPGMMTYDQMNKIVEEMGNK